MKIVSNSFIWKSSVILYMKVMSNSFTWEVWVILSYENYQKFFHMKIMSNSFICRDTIKRELRVDQDIQSSQGFQSWKKSNQTTGRVAATRALYATEILSNYYKKYDI